MSDSKEGVSGEEQSGGRASALANLALVGASLLVSALLLAAIEGGLRLAGVGADDLETSRLKYQQIYFPTLEPARRADGTAVLRPVDPRLRFQSILRDKPEGQLRIVTFGGSATAGLGFSPNVTFARELERALELAYPERRVEILNLGIVALASAQVKLLVAEAARHYEPDVMIVYAGNNEFLEVHAEKYAAAQATPLSRTVGALMDLNLYRFINGLIRGPRRKVSFEERQFSTEDLRLTQDTIIKSVTMSQDEIDEVVDRYEANLRDTVEVAEETATPLVLMTVAANWKWRGRSDLPEGWIDELLGARAAEGPERLRRARDRLTEMLASSAPDERHELLFKRGVVEEKLGETAAARDDYRAAMNEDPHLRRALDRANERVRSVASRNGVRLVDTVDLLASRAAGGIIGFDEFYDYVHFTPRGNAIEAAALFEKLQQMGVTGPAPGFDVWRHAESRIASLATLEADALAVDEWMGFGFDPATVGDRDLWKYEKTLKQLDERIAANPRDVVALVYRGNGHYFRVDGGSAAGRDYRAALNQAPGHPVIRANFARLESEGRLPDDS
jgi:lysophospholipase L1-like esterase